MNALQRIIRSEDGAALVEYGLLVRLISVACLVALSTLGRQVSTAFSRIASALAA